MKVLIPMAGLGHRFAEYSDLPKPLIDVNGQPMISRVLDNLDLPGQHIFIVRTEHLTILEPLLKQHRPTSIIITVDKVTDGAACTCLLAKEYIDNDQHLVIANCDQLMNWDSELFLNAIHMTDVDGYILTFKSDSPKHSYAKINRHGYVTRVAEKEVISNIATCGVYHWSKGSYMVEACEQMISKNIRCKGEFYLCPSYNEMIDKGLIVKTFPVIRQHPIGTPEDLEEYLSVSQ